MLKVDFVPNDYIQQRESGRTNLVYLFLVAVFILAIFMTFVVIKMRQKVVTSELAALDVKMAETGEQIVQLEKLKIKSKTMMKTMLTTAQLLDPVPKSIMLASLTNNLPATASLLELKLIQKESKQPRVPKAPASQYQSAGKVAQKPEMSREKRMETHIAIRGIAPSDIEVALYIARLSESILFDNVELVESKEHKIEKVKFREFKLKAMLKKEIMLTREDIVSIKSMNRRML